jgi:hypothetical protein
VMFLMVKAMACHIIQPTITWDIHVNKGCHQLLSKSIMPQLPAVYLEANIFSIVPVEDEGIQDRGIYNEGQQPVPPFMALQCGSIVLSVLIDDIHAPHALLILQQNWGRWEIDPLPPHPSGNNTIRVKRVQGC